ncbi:hypothetical protein FHS26_003765 [Rhizobium pisi]|uniref:Uncharacterized protein n=1 Tax=Rhizobium pisi TaxID=574561 RepID=A0A7W5BQ53_9HYPH|nr:hypothetical protein [Rhizobium pisi]
MGLAGLAISGNGKRFQSASDDQADATVISNARSALIAPYPWKAYGTALSFRQFLGNT